jgi:hypothetical protein
VAGGNTIVLDQWPCSFQRNACGSATFQQKYEISNQRRKEDELQVFQNYVLREKFGTGEYAEWMLL